MKEAIDRVNNDEYLRSALDYLEVHLRIGKEVLYSKKNVNCPNFRGTVLLAIALYKEHMRRFEKLLYASFA